MPHVFRHVRSGCLALVLVLAGPGASRQAVAQGDDMAFADLASATFGLVCLYLNSDDLDHAALLLGLTPVRDADLVARMIPGGPARAWSMLQSGNVFLLGRREQDGACLMELLGGDGAFLRSAIDRLLRRLRGALFEMVEEEVPRGFPLPVLRARYRLTYSSGATLVEIRVEEDPRLGRRTLVVLRNAP